MHRFGLSQNEARRLVHQLEHSHAPIAKYFHSGAGCWLQWYDSRMADRILAEATRRGIHVLPIHDSFIVPATRKAIAEELMEEAFHNVIFEGRRAPRILNSKQMISSKPFHIMLESPSLPSPDSFPWRLSGFSGLFGLDRHLTQSGRLALSDAKRRRCIHQEKLAGLVGISRPALSNILAGRFGTSPEVAERIVRIVLTTSAHERQPFLPGLAA